MDRTLKRLVELLDEIQDSGCSGEIECHGRNYPDTISNEAVAEHLAANNVMVFDWVPATQKPPHGEMVVLLTSRKTYIFAKWDGISWLYYGNCGDDFGCPITHWAPIPKVNWEEKPVKEWWK